jgi:NAD(P)-dependent dehydrogenase (short-subunit alcohol dehydrogenase family)
MDRVTVDSREARAGAVELLVDNLSICQPKPSTEITDQDWQRYFEVNVLSGVRLSRFYLP